VGRAVGLIVAASWVGRMEGVTLGNCDGAVEDMEEGSVEGAFVTGRMEGSLDDSTLGNNDGNTVGFFEGSFDRIAVGVDNGTAVGRLDGDRVGEDRASATFPFESLA